MWFKQGSLVRNKPFRKYRDNKHKSCIQSFKQKDLLGSEETFLCSSQWSILELTCDAPEELKEQINVAHLGLVCIWYENFYFVFWLVTHV